MPIFGNPYANTPAGMLRKLNEKWRKNLLDPTFGKTTKGAFAGSYANRILGSWFTCPDSGTANSITVYLKQYGTYLPKIKCAIYKKVTNALVGYTEEWTLTSGWDAWKTFNIVSGGTLAANTDYYLVVWASTYVTTYYDGVTGAGAYQVLTYDAFPDPWSPTVDNLQWSIYCTYSVPVAWGGSALPQVQMAKAILGV